MTVRVESDLPEINRALTGIWSLDHALEFQGQVGVPLRSICEIYGRPGYGKSSLAYYMAAKVKPTGKVVIADLEANVDKKFLELAVTQAGFNGVVKAVDYSMVKDKKKKPRPHESMCQEAVDSILDDEVNGVVIDSIGSFTPIMEREGDIEEAFMGQRAKRVSNLVRRAVAWLRVTDDPKLLVFVNHVHDLIGGPVKGHSTPGGNVLKYLANIRLWVLRSESFEDGCFEAEVRVEKLKYGGAGSERRGYFFVIPGIGVSPEMSAVMDCFRTEKAERGSYVKLGGKSIARLGALIEDARDPKANQAKFKPFFMALDKV
jgi:RecA/RadA recombinase